MSGPQITHATTDPSGDVYLHWAALVEDVVQTYNIYVYSGGSLYVQVSRSRSELEEYIFTGSEKLVPGNYTFQMDYRRPDMSPGPAGNVYNYTVLDVNPPYAPGNVSAVGGAGQIQVGWNQQAGNSTNADAAEYDVIVIPSDPSGFTTSTTVTTTTATITGLSADTYSVKIVARSAYGNTAESTTVTGIVVTGGGGGGGGGGGNNGGGGHNNMATLELDYSGYEGTATQNNTITVLGEEGPSLTGEVITINVTGTALQAVLAYQSNWTTAGDASGTQPQPKVKFLPSACSAAIEAMYADLKVLGDGAAGGAGRKFTDDASVQHSVFGDELLGLTFTDSALDDDELPRESIRQIAEGDITAPTTLLEVCVDLDTEVAAASGKPAHSALLKGLFEQAVAAGKVMAPVNGAGGDPPHATVTGYKMPSLAAGDSISFPVKFHFSKTRTYALDSDVSSGGSAQARSITIPNKNGGAAFTIDGATESSDAYSKTYVIKLVAV